MIRSFELGSDGDIVFTNVEDGVVVVDEEFEADFLSCGFNCGEFNNWTELLATVLLQDAFILAVATLAFNDEEVRLFVISTLAGSIAPISPKQEPNLLFINRLHWKNNNF